MTSYRASWIIPVDVPPIEDGILTIQGGRILEVRKRRPTEATGYEDLGDVILLPGLINAHTHLELGWCHGRIPPCDLWQWFKQLVALNTLPEAGAKRRASVMDGARASLAAGVTCIGDISRTGMNAALLQGMPIRKVCFVELISGAQNEPNDAASLEARLRSIDQQSADERLRLGISPHSLYTVTRADLTAAAALARRATVPISIHVMETSDERDWLRSGGGRVDDHLGRFALPTAASSPGMEAAAYLAECGLLELHPLLAHVNYINQAEVARLAEYQAHVVWCPRTHAYFGHAPHPWQDMLAAGINVCIGTDSLASAPTLSVLDELRFVRAGYPDFGTDMLIEMVTLRAARALGMERQIGSLTPGKAADVIAVPIAGPASSDPCADVMDSVKPIDRVWIGGDCIDIAP